MASARFRIGNSSSLSGPWTWGSYDTYVDVSASKYIKVELESTSGVGQIAVTIPSADEATMVAGLPTVTVDQATKTATFQVAADAGHTYLVRFTINAGTSSAAYKQLAVHILTTNSLRLVALGETDEYSRTYGWLKKINDAIRAI